MSSQPRPVKLSMDNLICGKEYEYITYFKDTCVSSVNKKHNNQYNRNQHQRPSNTSSNYRCQRVCCFCKKAFMIPLITSHSKMKRGIFSIKSTHRIQLWKLKYLITQIDNKHERNFVLTAIQQKYRVAIPITNIYLLLFCFSGVFLEVVFCLLCWGIFI